MSGYRPLSVRRGEREEAGPFEGVPRHLVAHLIDWVRSALGSSSGQPNARLVRAVALRLAIPMQIGSDAWDQREEILSTCMNQHQLLLDVIDLLLHAGAGNANELGECLTIGGSVWTVVEGRRALERRVGDEEAAAMSAAVGPADTISGELCTAWASAFGVRPDPSDAWDHAIKALEALLIPIVVPNQSKPTLGNVVGTIKSDPSRWTLDLESNGDQTDSETLLGLLNLVWANPDRHANANARLPTQEEAEKIVKIAVLIVGLCRNGGLRKSP